MTSLNNDQLTKAIKSLGAQNKKNHARLLIAIAALSVLMILVVVALFLNVNSANRIVAALEQQTIGGTQDALLTRCIAVVAYEGVDNPNRYEEIVDYCMMRRQCQLSNQSNATAAQDCVLRNNDATHEAELRNSP